MIPDRKYLSELPYLQLVYAVSYVEVSVRAGAEWAGIDYLRPAYRIYAGGLVYVPAQADERFVAFDEVSDRPAADVLSVR